MTVILLFLWWELVALAPRREWGLLLQKNTTVTAAKGQSFETVAMVVETNVDGDDGALSDDDISISIKYCGIFLSYL